ncbi:MAG: hypothetical protein EAZ53_05035 [Bacteroidetes bacterium]|nr:MAG: hypothetical protein EAZ53_05035 [Bacteroidota bacterium]
MLVEKKTNMGRKIKPNEFAIINTINNEVFFFNIDSKITSKILEIKNSFDDLPIIDNLKFNLKMSVDEYSDIIYIAFQTKSKKILIYSIKIPI